MKLISSTRTVILPNYARDGFQEINDDRVAKNYPLAGNMYVDTFSQRNGWRVSFDTLTAAEYDELRAIYQDQFDNEEFLTFDRTGLSGDIQSVFLSMPQERNIVWNQEAVIGLQITLEPEDANS